jgi:hypothetical protein
MGGAGVRQKDLKNRKEDFSCFIRLGVLGVGFKASPETGKSFEKFLPSFYSEYLCLDPDSVATFHGIRK